METVGRARGLGIRWLGLGLLSLAGAWVFQDKQVWGLESRVTVDDTNPALPIRRNIQ